MARRLPKKEAKIYVREFGSKMMISSTQVYPRSDYFPSPLKYSLFNSVKNGYIHADNWILCPLYDKKQFQIGVTGTVEYDELPVNAMAREMGEEIGLTPKPNERLVQTCSDWHRGKFYNIYEIDISKTIPIAQYQNGVNMGKKQDDRMKKVGCIVFGTEQQIVNFLSLPNIYRYFSRDKIIGIVGIKIGDV